MKLLKVLLDLIKKSSVRTFILRVGLESIFSASTF